MKPLSDIRMRILGLGILLVPLVAGCAQNVAAITDIPQTSNNTSPAIPETPTTKAGALSQPTLTTTQAVAFTSIARVNTRMALTPSTTPSVTLTPTFTRIPSLTPASAEGRSNAYRLGQWTMTDALEAIVEGKQLSDAALAGSVPTPAVYEYRDYANYVITLEYEALLRFPDGARRASLDWDLAYRASTSFDFQGTYPVASLLTTLEHALNSGELTPQTLGDALPAKGFRVTDVSPVNSVFHPGQPAIVVQIESDESRALFSSAAVVILAGVQPGDYHVTTVDNYWDPNIKNTKSFSVGDHNSNGRAEISVIDDYWLSFVGSAGACGSRLAVYEWQGDYPQGQFVNLAATIEDVFMNEADGACERPWGWDPTDQRGASELTAFARHYSPGEGTCKIYKWNGQDYALVGEGTMRPGNSEECRVERPVATLTFTPTPTTPPQYEVIRLIEQTLFQQGSLNQARDLIQQLLADEIIEPDLYGSGQRPARIRPYLLYLLGLTDELSGNNARATEVYWQLWHNFPESPYTVIVRRKLEPADT